MNHRSGQCVSGKTKIMSTIVVNESTLSGSAVHGLVEVRH